MIFAFIDQNLDLNVWLIKFFVGIGLMCDKLGLGRVVVKRVFGQPTQPSLEETGQRASTKSQAGSLSFSTSESIKMLQIHSICDKENSAIFSTAAIYKLTCRCSIKPNLANFRV